MVYILFGILGFLILGFVDLPVIQRNRILKPLLWICGAAALLLSIVLLTVYSSPLAVSTPWRILSGLLAAAMLILSVRSLFIELPVRQSYAEAAEERTLVKSGSYGMVRHPGVLWFSLFLPALAAALNARDLLRAAPIFICLNILLALLQDMIYFPRIFGPAYEAYKKEVPFLIPTVQGIKQFITGRV
jgi:protein-S-isoprenylcysteine O-methyltransferase Ste14